MNKDNSGALFKNDKKESDKHPDYKGSIQVSGQEMWISAWLNQSAKGVKYMSLSVQPKEKQAAQTSQSQQAEYDDFGDSDIPF